MKKILFLLVAMLLASNAWGFSYQPFTFDTQLGDSYDISQSLDVTGDSVIFTDFTGAHAGIQVGTFEEVSTFKFPGYSSGGAAQFAVDGYEFTATFSAQGNIFQSGGDQWFEFTSGTMEMYLQEYGSGINYNTGAADGSFNGADDGFNIASWTLTGGGGELTSLFAPTDGEITAYFDAQEILSGYFFDQNGNDMSDWDLLSGSPILTLGYAHVTTQDYTPPTLPNPFAEEAWEFLNPGEDYGSTYPNDNDPSDGSQTLYESHGGGFEIRVVPEPATFLLFGIGLLGLAGVSRKKRTT